MRRAVLTTTVSPAVKRSQPTPTEFKNTFTRFDTVHKRNRQTDGQTDGRTPRRHIGCTVHSIAWQKPERLTHRRINLRIAKLGYLSQLILNNKLCICFILHPQLFCHTQSAIVRRTAAHASLETEPVLAQSPDNDTSRCGRVDV